MSAVLPSPFDQNTLIQRLYAEIESLKSRFCKMETKVSTLETELTEVKTENADLKNELEETNLQLDAFKNRNTRLEKIIFECDEDGEIKYDNKTAEPIINKNFTCATEKPVTKPKPVVTPTIETEKDERTVAVVEYLKTEVKINDFGKYTIGMKELKIFLTTVIEPRLRLKKVSRQMKKDIFERAEELYPDDVEITTGLSKNKTKSLTLKPSVKSQGTHGRMRRTLLGILA